MRLIKWLNLRWWIIKLWFCRGIEIESLTVADIWIPTARSLAERGHDIMPVLNYLTIYTERSTEDEEAQQD